MTKHTKKITALLFICTITLIGGCGKKNQATSEQLEQNIQASIKEASNANETASVAVIDAKGNQNIVEGTVNINATGAKTVTVKDSNGIITTYIVNDKDSNNIYTVTSDNIITTSTNNTVNTNSADNSKVIANNDTNTNANTNTNSNNNVQTPVLEQTQPDASAQTPNETPGKELETESTEASSLASTEASTQATTKASTVTLVTCNANNDKVDAIFSDFVAGKITEDQATNLCLAISNEKGLCKWSDGTTEIKPCRVTKAKFQKVIVTDTVTSANYLTFGVAWEYTKHLTVANEDGTKTIYSVAVVSMPN